MKSRQVSLYLYCSIMFYLACAHLRGAAWLLTISSNPERRHHAIYKLL